MAKIRAGIELRSRNCSIVRLKTLLSTKPSVSRMRMPRTRVAADVPEIRLSSQYSSSATMAISRMALMPNRAANESHTLCSSASMRSIGAAKSMCLPSVQSQQPQQQRFLRVQPVLGLIVNNRGRPIHHSVGYFMVAMCRKAVHGDDVRASVREQLSVQLVGTEGRRPRIGFTFLTHAVPGVGVHGVGVADRFSGIAEQLETATRHPSLGLLHDLRIGLVTVRAGEAQIDPERGRRKREGMSDVIAVADVRQ